MWRTTSYWGRRLIGGAAKRSAAGTAFLHLIKEEALDDGRCVDDASVLNWDDSKKLLFADGTVLVSSRAS